MNNPWRAAGWVLLGASLILALSLGIRHGFGLFLSPMSGEYGWGREVFAFAIALQNLIWGLAQPITGAVADRFGARRVIIGGGLLYAAGLVAKRSFGWQGRKTMILSLVAFGFVFLSMTVINLYLSGFHSFQ